MVISQAAQLAVRSMSTETHKAVSILFETPSGDADSYHQRTLWGVPKSVADMMKMDFIQYGDPEYDCSPHQIYQYKEEDEQRVVALDFCEVVGITLCAHDLSPPCL